MIFTSVFVVPIVTDRLEGGVGAVPEVVVVLPLPDVVLPDDVELVVDVVDEVEVV